MSSQKALFAGLFCSLVCLFSPLLHGQATGSFSGTVSDNSGAVVAGAKVTVTAQATNISREATSDDTGHFLIPLLGVADYTLKVEAPGFKAAEAKNVRLQIDEHRELDFKLVPASVTTSVEVNATEVAVQTSNATLGQVITEQQVAELPLNGRDFVQLATLTPGTTQETNPNSFFNGGPSSEVSTRGSYSLSVGGSRPQSTDWLLDGNDNNELTAGGIAILPSIDAIQEFKVLTYNYSAEWGTRAGPTVLVTTKSGSNRFHGSLFEFFRNTKLDARSYFAATKEQFNLNQFGGALGGAIQKDKTFFFIDYQAKRQRHGIPFNGFVPTAAMRTGDFSSDLYGNPIDFTDPNNANLIIYNPYTTTSTGTQNNPVITRSQFMCTGSSTGPAILANADGTQTGGVPCNKIPSNLFDPVAQQMVSLYPATVPSAEGSGYNYVNVPVRSLNEGEFDIRLDHNFSSKDSVFARFSYDQAVSFVPGGSPGFAEAGAFASTQDITNHGRNVAISETHIFSDRNINEFTAGFNRIFNHIKSFGDRSCESAQLGIPGANLAGSCPSLGVVPPGLSQSTKDCVSCGLTSTIIGGPYWSLGDRGFAPFQGGTNVFSISDSFDMIRGNHNIRVGAGFRDHQMNVLANAFQDGFWVFTNTWSSAVTNNFAGGGGGDNMADFLLGMPDLGLHDQTFKGATTGRRWKLFRPYVQDDWRVSNNLTVNLGFAWALVTPITEAQNRQANFDYSKALGATPCSPQPDCDYLVPGLNSNARVGIQMDKSAFEPRIGLAWKPLGSQTTAVRAGYAIFHDSSWNQGAQGLWENPPFFMESAVGSFFFPDLCPFSAPQSGGVAPACATAGNTLPTTGLPASAGFPVFASSPGFGSFAGTVQSQNLNFKQGIVQQFNLNIEHQLPGNIVLTAGYAGSRSHHIMVDGMNLNAASPNACPGGSDPQPGYTLGCGVTSLPPALAFTVVAATADAGSARYDSLQVKAETKSSRHGIYALLGYTYARNFDSGFNDGLGSTAGATYWPLPGTQKADWGLSQINLNHNFTASVIYDLPFGKGKRFGGTWSGPLNAIAGNWEVDVIEKATSGFPIFMIASTNNSGSNLTNNGNNYNRPDQICSAKASHPTLQEWFNKDCFAAAASGELGDAPRAPAYGPRFVNTDFSAIKHFLLPWEEMRLDFRAEFFNVFNHAQFGQPVSDVNSPSFGTISSTVNNPRVIQFALKLNF